MVILMTADFEVLEKVKNLELLGINDTSRAMTSAELERFVYLISYFCVDSKFLSFSAPIK